MSEKNADEAALLMGSDSMMALNALAELLQRHHSDLSLSTRDALAKVWNLVRRERADALELAGVMGLNETTTASILRAAINFVRHVQDEFTGPLPPTERQELLAEIGFYRELAARASFLIDHLPDGEYRGLGELRMMLHRAHGR